MPVENNTTDLDVTLEVSTRTLSPKEQEVKTIILTPQEEEVKAALIRVIADKDGVNSIIQNLNQSLSNNTFKRFNKILGPTITVFLSLLLNYNIGSFIFKHFRDILKIILNFSSVSKLQQDPFVIKYLSQIGVDNIQILIKNEVIQSFLSTLRKDEKCSKEFLKALAIFLDENKDRIVFNAEKVMKFSIALHDAMNGDIEQRFELLNLLTSFAKSTTGLGQLFRMQKPMLVALASNFLNRPIKDLISEEDIEDFVGAFLCNPDTFLANIELLQPIFEALAKEDKDVGKIIDLSVKILTDPTVVKFLTVENRRNLFSFLALDWEIKTDAVGKTTTQCKGLSGIGKKLQAFNVLQITSPIDSHQVKEGLTKDEFIQDYVERHMELHFEASMEKLLTDKDAQEKLEELLVDFKPDSQEIRLKTAVLDLKLHLKSLEPEEALKMMKKMRSDIETKENNKNLLARVLNHVLPQEIKIEVLDDINDTFLTFLVQHSSPDLWITAYKACTFVKTIVEPLKEDEKEVIEVVSNLKPVEEVLTRLNITQEIDGKTTADKAFVENLLTEILDADSMQSLANIMLQIKKSDMSQVTLEVVNLLSNNEKLRDFLKDQKHTNYLLNFLQKLVADNQREGKNLASDDLLKNLADNSRILGGIIEKALPLVNREMYGALEARMTRGAAEQILVTKAIQNKNRLLTPEERAAIQSKVLQGDLSDEEKDLIAAETQIQDLFNLLYATSHSTIKSILEAKEFADIQIGESAVTTIITKSLQQFQKLDLDFGGFQKSIVAHYQEKQFLSLAEEKIHKELIKYLLEQREASQTDPMQTFSKEELDRMLVGVAHCSDKVREVLTMYGTRSYLSRIYFQMENSENSKAIQKRVANIIGSFEINREVEIAEKAVKDLQKKIDSNNRELKTKVKRLFSIKQNPEAEKLVQEQEELQRQLSEAQKVSDQKVVEANAFLNKILDILQDEEIENALISIIDDRKPTNYLLLTSQLLQKLVHDGVLSPENKQIIKSIIFSLNIDSIKGYEAEISYILDQKSPIPLLNKLLKPLADGFKVGDIINGLPALATIPIEGAIYVADKYLWRTSQERLNSRTDAFMAYFAQSKDVRFFAYRTLGTITLEDLNLSGKDLSKGIFHNLSFKGTDLSNTNLSGSSFETCDFTQATNIRQINFKDARFDLESLKSLMNHKDFIITSLENATVTSKIFGTMSAIEVARFIKSKPDLSESHLRDGGIKKGLIDFIEYSTTEQLDKILTLRSSFSQDLGLFYQDYLSKNFLILLNSDAYKATGKSSDFCKAVMANLDFFYSNQALLQASFALMPNSLKKGSITKEEKALDSWMADLFLVNPELFKQLVTEKQVSRLFSPEAERSPFIRAIRDFAVSKDIKASRKEQAQKEGLVLQLLKLDLNSQNSDKLEVILKVSEKLLGDWEEKGDKMHDMLRVTSLLVKDDLLDKWLEFDQNILVESVAAALKPVMSHELGVISSDDLSKVSQECHYQMISRLLGNCDYIKEDKGFIKTVRQLPLTVLKQLSEGPQDDTIFANITEFSNLIVNEKLTSLVMAHLNNREILLQIRLLKREEQEFLAGLPEDRQTLLLEMNSPYLNKHIQALQNHLNLSKDLEESAIDFLLAVNAQDKSKNAAALTFLLENHSAKLATDPKTQNWLVNNFDRVLACSSNQLMLFRGISKRMKIQNDSNLSDLLSKISKLTLIEDFEPYGFLNATKIDDQEQLLRILDWAANEKISFTELLAALKICNPELQATMPQTEAIMILKNIRAIQKVALDVVIRKEQNKNSQADQTDDDDFKDALDDAGYEAMQKAKTEATAAFFKDNQELIREMIFLNIKPEELDFSTLEEAQKEASKIAKGPLATVIKIDPASNSQQLKDLTNLITIAIVRSPTNEPATSWYAFMSSKQPSVTEIFHKIFYSILNGAYHPIKPLDAKHNKRFVDDLTQGFSRAHKQGTSLTA